MENAHFVAVKICECMDITKCINSNDMVPKLYCPLYKPLHDKHIEMQIKCEIEIFYEE